MKKIIFILVVLVSCNLYSQKKDKKNNLDFVPVYRLHLLQPIAIGDNALSKSHKNSYLGFGTSITLAEYDNFGLGFGLDLMKFKVSDQTKIGNFDKSSYSSVYMLATYDYKFNKKITLVPYFGIGEVKINLKDDGERFARQGGTEFRVGITADYSIDKTVSFYGGLNYIYSKLKVDTNANVENYFNNSQLVQISVGIKLK